MNFEKPNQPSQKQNELEALEAIKRGDAMPLPEFLNESPEAREAFAGAIQESQYLNSSLNELDPEAKKLFLSTFSDAIDIEDRSVFYETMTSIVNPSGFDKEVVLGVGALGVAMEGGHQALEGLHTPDIGPLFIATMAAVGVWAKYKDAKWKIEDDTQNIQDIKDQLLTIAAA